MLEHCWHDQRTPMSIYCGYRALPSDVQVRSGSGKHSTEGSAAQSPPHHLRRAQPVLVLFPQTAIWIASLPKQVRPNALVSQFARIANLICAAWGEPTACRKYLAELLVDERGGRKGFPMAVLREIRVLQAYHAHVNQLHNPDADWVGPIRSMWDGPERDSR
jgi:hypothetical protein